jgi:hypothetical protein
MISTKSDLCSMLTAGTDVKRRDKIKTKLKLLSVSCSIVCWLYEDLLKQETLLHSANWAVTVEPV